MIELSDDQRQELSGDLPRVFDPRTNTTYVLVREEAYERMQALLAPERLTLGEQQALLHKAALRAGWDDAEMDVYDREENSLESP